MTANVAVADSALWLRKESRAVATARWNVHAAFRIVDLSSQRRRRTRTD